MYDTNAAARRLTAILGVKPSKKPLIRSYLQEAYASALNDATKDMNIPSFLDEKHWLPESGNGAEEPTEGNT